MPKVVNLGTPTSPSIYTHKYGTFRGVDFSQSETMVDDSRSPHAVNLIADTNGFPEKRLGWRTTETFSSRINGIFSFGAENNNCMVIHAGDKLFAAKNGEKELLLEGIADRKSAGKYFKGKLCILTGAEFLVFDGEKAVKASEYEKMYAPITTAGRGGMNVGSGGDPLKDVTFLDWYNDGVIKNYDGTEVPLGEMPEGSAVNLVSGKRKNHFEKGGNGQIVFILDRTIDIGSRVTFRCIATSEELFSLEFNSNTGRQEYTSAGEGEVINTDVLVEMPNETAPYTKRRVIIGNSTKNGAGYVICQPNTSKLNGYTSIPGIDDFSVEFTSTVEGYAERIDKCTIMDVFENRVFFSGNPDYPNTDWYSGVNDALYVPDINYTEIGMDSSAIMGYLRTGDQQAILKSDGDDATIFMRAYNMQSDGTVIFSIRQGVSGIGASAKGAICSFLDDPMYVSKNGVYAIAQQDIASERALAVRSTRINNKLLDEEDLEEAVMTEWNGYLVLAVNGKAYVADAAQKSYAGNKTGTFEYEWYYWTNIPARVLHEDEGVLYFGTEDGRICRFNNDMKSGRGGYEPTAYSDDGEAIVAEWSTNLSDDGDFMRLKTMKKKGSGIMLKTYIRSGVKVCIRTDKEFEREILSKSAGIFNFEDIDFSDFTFNTSEYSVIPFNAKFKKYKAIQIIVRNDKVNHAFGILGIIRRYVVGNYAK